MRSLIYSNYSRVTLSNKKLIVILRDRIHLKRGSHNRLTIIGKIKTEIESSKSNRTIRSVCRQMGKTLDPWISNRQSKLKSIVAKGLLSSILEFEFKYQLSNSCCDKLSKSRFLKANSRCATNFSSHALRLTRYVH